MFTIIVLLPIALAGTILTLGIFFPLSRMLWRDNQRFLLSLASLMTVLFFGILYYGHCQALTHLTQVEAEYRAFVKYTQPQGYYHNGDITRYYHAPDQERLNILLAKRDSILQKNGFIRIGEWKPLANGPSTDAVYLRWR